MMVAGDKRRSAENLEVKTLDYFVDICRRATNTRDACLIALLFLSGRRISELVGLKQSDLSLTTAYLVLKTFNLKAFRSQPNKEFTLLLHDRYYSIITVDISRSTEAYQCLGGFIESHINTLKDDEYIFYKFSRTYKNDEGVWKRDHIGSNMAYLIVRFLDPSVWPHWFRHQRFTQVYNITKSKVKDPFDVVMALHDFTKHRRLDTTMNYIKGLKLQEIKKEI